MRQADDKHNWWKMWDDVTVNRNMRRWIREHGHGVAWAWVACMKLANNTEKDGRLCDRKSGDFYTALDVADEALVTTEQAGSFIELFLASGWMHRAEDGCLVATRFYDRQVDPATRRVRDHRKRKEALHETLHETQNVTRNVTPKKRTEDRGQRTEDRSTESPPLPPSPGGTRERKPALAPLTADERPDWLPSPEWEAYEDARRRGKGWTERARKMALGVLERARAEGIDPAQVLTQSVVAGWTGLFPDRLRSRTQAGPQVSPVRTRVYTTAKDGYE